MENLVKIKTPELDECDASIPKIKLDSEFDVFRMNWGLGIHF